MPVAIYPDLAGRVIAVTGGATGIGAAIVRAFAGQGAVTCFLDRAETEGHALSAQLRQEGLMAPFLACDVTRTRDLQVTLRRMSVEHGTVSVLVNNVGNDQRHRVEDLTPERFDGMIAVNLRHLVFAAQTVVPMMRSLGGGSIVNLGSISWRVGGAGYPVYSAAKAAVHGFTRALARDVGQERIRVNTISPGWVMTDKQRRLWMDEARAEAVGRSQCLPGDLLPDHIAQMALFLGSDASAMCTAQDYIVDGGWA